MPGAPGRFQGLVCRVLGILAILAASVPANADPGVTDSTTPDAREGALGGPHVAWTEIGNALETNVAGLRFVDNGFRFSALTVQTAGPVFDIASVLLQGFSGVEFASLVSTPEAQELFDGVYARAAILGPVAISYVRNGFGISFDNLTAVRVQGSGTSGLDVRSSERLVLRGGYSLQLPLPDSWNVTLAIGLGANTHLTASTVASTSLVTLSTMLNSLESSLLSDATLEQAIGGGIDAGLMFTAGGWLAIGLSATDIYAPTFTFPITPASGFFSGSYTKGERRYDTEPLDLTVGAAFTPPLGAAERIVRDFTVAFDYRDILDFWLDPADADNLFLKFGIGVEATLLQVLCVRAGFDRGMIAAGFGLELGMFDLSAAMYLSLIHI